jgi:hypothetical protein
MYKFLKTLQPGRICRIFCSVSGRDDHYATQLAQGM